ncbi:MAG: response regulator [Deltaproteobacteria bacterium]|nr:response regulator [Deltaproteobacteria bacterium]
MLDSNARILLVDDSSTVRRIIGNILRQSGYHDIEEATDGLFALKALLKEKFDLIICDWNMPRINGLELFKRVRSNDVLKDTPFLMVTAESTGASVLKAAETGVTYYITKPFSQNDLLAKIAAIFP